VTEAIAIVGLGCRFPGASDVESFWRLLRDGRVAISEIPASRWNIDSYYAPEPATPGKMSTRWAGLLESVDTFEPAFFGISPREAAAMDPQQRLLLEVAWEALEGAGQNPRQLAGSQTGVFVGISSGDYARLQDATSVDAYSGTGNAHSVAANRLSYTFDLRGPSLAVDTACSSSLVAVHLACESLRRGESNLALAAGVNVIVAPELSIAFSQARMLAPGAQCRVFDASADGYVRGEGCGVVVLKRLSEARANGDHVWAIIRGSAVNQDGLSNGLTAPNGPAQSDVIRAALRRAGTQPTEVSYVEAHGTGTPLGDPIELRALGAVLSPGRATGSPITVGSLKANIGHLEAAAGIAGLIKVALMLDRHEIPPQPNVQKLNPHVPWDDLALRVPSELDPWQTQQGSRRAGVSSFGFGGTNAHVVLAEAAEIVAVASHEDRPRHLLALSARTPEALRALAGRFAEHLREAPEASLANVCFTANTGRAQFSHRAGVTASSVAEMREQLAAFTPSDARATRRPRVAFLFTGQGSQHVGMARQLLATEPGFRALLERCAAIADQYLQQPLLDVLYPSPEASTSSRLDQTAYAQVALFALEVGLAALWKSWGVSPAAVVGHSVGEYAAAYVAGAVQLEEGLRLVAERGRLMQSLPASGAMAVVMAEAARVSETLATEARSVAIASINGPGQTVLSGTSGDLKLVLERLQRRGIHWRPLNVSHAFHSPSIDPMLDAFEAVAATVRFAPPEIPLISNLTGEQMRSAPDSQYWRRHAREPVQWSRAMTTLAELQCDAFLEIGPRPTLIGLGQGCFKQPQPGLLWLPSLRPGQDDWQVLLESLSALYERGADLDWEQLDSGYQRRRVLLPTYPFERERYWFATRASAATRCEGAPASAQGHAHHPLLGGRLPSPLPTSEFEAHVGLQALPYLSDHRIDGAAIMPATAYLASVLAAAEETFGPGPHTIADVAFDRALFLPEAGERCVRLAAEEPCDGRMTFEIFSSEGDAAPAKPVWTRHVTGTIESADHTTHSPRTTSLEDIWARCTAEISGGEHYRLLRERGMAYGPAFQGVARVWRRDGEGLGEVDLPALLVEEASAYHVHPALLDASLQVLSASLPTATVRAIGGGAFLPVRLGEVRVYQRPSGKVWSHARLRPSTADSTDEFEADVCLLDADGQVLVEVLGFCVRRLGAAAHTPEEPANNVYRLQWQPAPGAFTVPKGEYAQPGDTRTWLVLADRGNVGQRLARLIESRGMRCLTVYADAEQDIRGVLNQAVRFRGIVHLWSLDTPAAIGPDPTFLHAAQQLGCASALELTRALLEIGAPDPPRVWLVTRGAQVIGNEAPIRVADAPLWGFGRSVALEHPELWGGLIDLDPSPPNDEAEQLLDTILGTDGEDQVALRHGARFAARLARFHAPDRTLAPTRLRADATYMITGGLGALGLRVARRLVERGARRLVLVSRGGLPPRDSWRELRSDSAVARQVAAIEDLERTGATVLISATDVGDPRAVAELFKLLRGAWPALRGLVHAAGVAHPQPVRDASPSDLHQMFRAKVDGTWLLHQHTANLDLDFFVLFSSVAGTWGSSNLSLYAAANHFLDAVAQHRRACGLPGLSIAWGPWAESGMAADADWSAALERTGLRLLAPEVALACLEHALATNEPRLIVANVEWSRFKATYAARYEHHVFDALATSNPTPLDRGAAPTVDVLASPRTFDRQRLLVELRKRIAGVLRIEAVQLEFDQPLNGLGLDSLMAIELKHGFETDLGVGLPMVTLLNNPTIRELADRIIGLQAESVVEERSIDSADVSTLDASEFPLSHGQQALWFLHQLAPRSTAYNIAGAVRICEPLDPSALRRAFQRLAERHASLRTTFLARDGQPVQRIADTGQVALDIRDAAGWSELDLSEHLSAAADQPFDLERGPLLRVSLFTRSPNDHALLLVIHHTVADFWSLVILIHELGLLYPEEVSGAAAVLPPLERHYVNYVRWQSELLASPAGESMWAYWRNQLGGELPMLELPADRPRPPVQTYRGASETRGFGPELTGRLRALSERHGATLYVTLLAAFQTLLHRFSGQNDILVGSPTAGRSRADDAPVVGYFVNPVVLRGRFDDDPTFDSLLTRMHDTVLAAFEHQDMPFAVLVNRLQPVRDASRSPIFQAMFVLQRAQLLDDQGLTPFVLREEGARMRLGGLAVESLTLQQRVAQFDVTLVMVENGDGLLASLEYNTDLFDAASIRRMLEHFGTLLEGVVTDPDQPVSRLPLVPTADRQKMLEVWNATATDTPLGNCLHELVENRAHQTPDAQAVVSEDGALTYAALNRRANRLAHYLRSRGVGPDVLVAVHLERSLDLVVALLGILKAGGAYLPLDPESPRERRVRILEDAQPAVLLTRAAFDADQPPADARTIYLETKGPAIALQPDNNPASLATPDSLAYVIYTSGSTGMPKGVMVPHRGVVNRLLWMERAFNLGPEDCFLQKTSASFDVSAWELFMPLVIGARVVLSRPGGQRDPRYLTELMRTQRVSVVHFVPSMLRAFLALADFRTCPSLRHVVCSGEALTSDLVAAVRAASSAELHNLYGPTETSIEATAWNCGEAGVADGVPIGRPIDNVQVYVLDSHRQLVPVGVPGELFVGGAGLARGYLHQPHLTAERFVPDPFSPAPHRRLYRTGDRVRWRANGTLEFLGRFDDQLKIRGYRVEPAEVEAVIATHSSVARCAVVARARSSGDTELVAYLIPADGATGLPLADLRGYLRQRLPDAMIPSIFVPLQHLPLTSSGKLDRRALPEPEHAFQNHMMVVEPPCGPVEETLARIWEQILGVDRVGTNQNFFELGGDSILGIQVVSRARAAGLELEARDIFQCQTIGDLATVAHPVQPGAYEQNPVEGEAPLTPIQHWFFDQKLTRPATWNQSVVLQPGRPLDPDLLRRSLEGLVAHHDALRLRFTSSGDSWRQRYVAPTEAAPLVRYLDLTSIPPADREARYRNAAEDVQTSFDLANGPLVGALLVDFGGQAGQRLLLTAHHLLVDAYSWRILLDDLQALYHGLERGQPVDLPAKTVSFKDWSRHLAELAQSDNFRSDLGYWLAGGHDRIRSLPMDRISGRNIQASARTFRHRLTADETRLLLQRAPTRDGAWLRDALLSTLAWTISRWASSEQVAIDVESHGREGLDSSRTVGWFTSLYPVILDVPGGTTPSDALASTGEQLRAVPRRGLSYGALRYLSPDAGVVNALSARPAADICFNYLGQLDQLSDSSALFEVVPEEMELYRGPGERRAYPLEVEAFVAHGHLSVSWTYCAETYAPETIETQASQFAAALQTLAQPAAGGAGAARTPADFPLVRIDQRRLDRLVRRLSQSNSGAQQRDA
jgi:hybrid polyketide synthase/nonribosomal peptide synthetase FtdB